jgi:hypothetical protein
VPSSFDYGVIRVVPRVEREEFHNVGVLLYCLSHDFLGARVHLDEARLRALCPDADLEAIRSHLDTIPLVCDGGPDAGPIGRLPQKDRWHWLVAPRSSAVQVGPVHTGLCDDPRAELDRLVEKLVLVGG